MVYSKNSSSNRIFFIKKGSVAMYSNDYENHPVMIYEKGSFFGEIGVFLNKKRLFSCRAIENLELLVMNKVDFMKLFGRHRPSLFHLFLITVQKRWTDIEKVLGMLSKILNSEFLVNKSDHSLLLNKNKKPLMKLVSDYTISKKCKVFISSQHSLEFNKIYRGKLNFTL